MEENKNRGRIMSVSYTTSLCLGIVLNKNQILKKHLEKIGDHNMPQDVKFDSLSGKPLWREYYITLDNEDGCEDSPNCAEELFGFEIIHGGYDLEEDVVVIGKSIGDISDSDLYNKEQTKMMNTLYPTECDILKEKMKAQFEPLGLWDDDKFGYHLLMSCG